MNTFRLKISSPEGDVFAGDIVKITLRGAEGDLAILKGHVPFITSVQPCSCVITKADGEEVTGNVSGGLLTVSKELVTLLSGSFSW